MCKQTVNTEELSRSTMRRDNPRTPYDESEVVPSITLSKEVREEHFEGTGFNPEGPPRAGRADPAGLQGPLQPGGQVRQDLA